MTKCTQKKKKDWWTIRCPNVSDEQRAIIDQMASDKRMSIGSYVASLLDAEVKRYKEK